MGNEISCAMCPIGSQCVDSTHCHITIRNEANNGYSMTNPQIFHNSGSVHTDYSIGFYSFSQEISTTECTHFCLKKNSFLWEGPSGVISYKIHDQN